MNERVSASPVLSRMLEESSRATLIVSKIYEDQSPLKKHIPNAVLPAKRHWLPLYINAELLSAIIFLHQMQFGWCTSVLCTVFSVQHCQLYYQAVAHISYMCYKD